MSKLGPSPKLADVPLRPGYDRPLRPNEAPMYAGQNWCPKFGVTVPVPAPKPTGLISRNGGPMEPATLEEILREADPRTARAIHSMGEIAFEIVNNQDPSRVARRVKEAIAARKTFRALTMPTMPTAPPPLFDAMYGEGAFARILSEMGETSLGLPRFPDPAEFLSGLLGERPSVLTAELGDDVFERIAELQRTLPASRPGSGPGEAFDDEDPAREEDDHELDDDERTAALARDEADSGY